MSVIRVGAHVPQEVLKYASTEAVPPSETRNTKYIQTFLDSVRIDKFFGQYSNDFEYDMQGWEWQSNPGRWVKTSGVTKYRSKWFDPRVAKVTSRDGRITAFYKMHKQIGEGSFGRTVLFKKVDRGGIDERNNIFESFIMKIPQSGGDNNEHEALVIETLRESGAFSDLMCASTKVINRLNVILLETFDGDLTYFQHKLSVEQAFQVAYAVYQECAAIYRITEPRNLIHEDLKLENVLYSNKYRPQRYANDCFTVCVADFGGFVPKGSRRGKSTYTASIANAHGHVSDERHFSFCLGGMIIEMLSIANGVSLYGLRYLEREDSGDIEKADVVATTLEKFIKQSINEAYQTALLQIIGIRDGKFIDTDQDDVTNTFDKIGRVFRKVFNSQRVVYRPVPIDVSGKVRQHYSEDDSENEDSVDDDPDFKGPTRIIPDIKKVFRPWDPEYGYHSFESALNAIEHGPPYRSKCRCECNCMRYRESGEEWEVVGPSHERLYDYWAANNPPRYQYLSESDWKRKVQNVWFVTCEGCAINFNVHSDHICTGTGAEWPKADNGKWLPLRNWSPTQAENFVRLQDSPELKGMSGVDLINATGIDVSIKNRIQEFSKLEE